MCKVNFHCILIVNALTYLRYYATFKVRKFESFFYKINTCLQKTITWIITIANILCKYLIYIFFQFWTWLFRSFYYDSKLQVLVIKKFWNNFCYIVLLFQKVCLRFKIIFQTENINIFILYGVAFSRYV